MAKAIEQLGSGLVVGHAGLRSVAAADPVVKDVHDGDTVAVVADGDFGVRFLGVDAPELSTPLPGTEFPFVALSDPSWEQALAAAIAPGAQPLGPTGDPALVAGRPRSRIACPRYGDLVYRTTGSRRWPRTSESRSRRTRGSGGRRRRSQRRPETSTPR